MAVQQCEASSLRRRRCEGAFKVGRLEAYIAMNIAIAAFRQQQLLDDGSAATSARARSPKGEAQIFLSVGA
jgi:hypothetical protein